jgi:hypothetical protein
VEVNADIGLIPGAAIHNQLQELSGWIALAALSADLEDPFSLNGACCANAYYLKPNHADLPYCHLPIGAVIKAGSLEAFE